MSKRVVDLRVEFITPAPLADVDYQRWCEDLIDKVNTIAHVADGRWEEEW